MIKNTPNKIKVIFYAAIVFHISIHSNVMADTMMESISKTINSNPELASSENTVFEAKARKKASASTFYPRLDAIGNIGRENIHNTPDSGAKSKTDMNRYSGTLRITAPIFSGFSSRYQHRANKHLFTAQVNDNKYLALKVVYNTIEAYLDVVKSIEILVATESNLRYHKRMMDLISARIRQGVSDKSELAQVEGRYNRASASAISAKSNVEIYEAKLEALAGEVSPPFFSPSLSTINDNRLNILDVRKKAITEHPKIIAKMARVDAAESSLSGSNSGYYPSVDIILDSTWEKHVLGYEGKKRDARGLVEARWNIFAGGETRAIKEQQHQKNEYSKNRLSLAKRQVLLEVANSYANYQSLKNQKKNIESYVSNMSKTESLYNQQFKVRKRTLLDLLNAQNELFSARKSEIAMKIDLLISWYRVQASMGELLSYLDIKYETPNI